MIYSNSGDQAARDAADELAAERERILAAQRERESSGLLAGLLSTDAGKPWSQSEHGPRRHIIDLPDIN